MKIDPQKQKAMEDRLNCRFHDTGDLAEMVQSLEGYREQTAPIEGVRYGWYKGSPALLQETVRAVNPRWVGYFPEGCPAFCAFIGDLPVSFCLIEETHNGILSGEQIGSIGCVGTVPSHRGRGIALRMVDLAALELQRRGMKVSYIHYTGIDHWYRKLGYQVLARFSIPG